MASRLTTKGSSQRSFIQKANQKNVVEKGSKSKDLPQPYLEVQDNCPDEAEDDGRPPVDHVAGVDIHEFDLNNKNKNRIIRRTQK